MMLARRQPVARSGMARMERRWGILMALPAIVGLVAFTVGPMLASLAVSLTDWMIGADPNWVGFANYSQLIDDPLFVKSLTVTSYYTFGLVPVILLVGFGVALLVNKATRGANVFRLIFYLPTIVPNIAAVVLWLWIFNPDFGLLNSLLRWAGLPPGQWIYSAGSALPSLIIMQTWAFGNIMVIFIAGLKGVPRHLYEAVEIDGGGAWRKFRHITLPMMTPIILYNLIMVVITTFQVFDQAYVMTKGGPENSTLFYVFYLYRTAFGESQMGYASAMAWVLFLIIAVATFLLFRSSRRWVYYEGARAR